MSKVKELEMNVQYVMNVLSAKGEQKAFESLETILETLGYKPQPKLKHDAVLIPVKGTRIECTNGMVTEDGEVLMNSPMSEPDLGDTLLTVKDVRSIMSELDDNDQVVVEACDEHGDVEDLYPMSMDIIEGIELTDGSIVREVRFCQRPNCEPDTRDKQPIVDALIDVLAEDMAKGDTTVLDELLLRFPFDVIKYALPEDMWADFEDKTYQTEDGHTKADCPKCEASEHIAYLEEYGECDICRHEKKD